MNRFNLENAIAELIKKLERYKSFEPGYIEEIKAHLLDKIDALVLDGLTKEQAFEQAELDVLDKIDEVANDFHKAKSLNNSALKDDNPTWIIALLPNFFKTSIRSMKRNKGYAFLNIAGLTIGLAACLLMVLFINHQLSFDQFHSKKDRIYRVLSSTSALDDSGEGGVNITTGWPVGQILASDYPEVEEVVYIRNFPTYKVKHNNQYFSDRSMLANQGFLNTFDFDLVEGNPATALSMPNQVVITGEMRDKFFGGESALGKTLTVRDTLDLTVSGVIESIPKNSHITFDFLVSFPTWLSRRTDFNTTSHWLDLNMNNYVLLKENADIEAVREKVSGIYMAGAGDYFTSLGFQMNVELEALTDIYLISGIGNNLGPRSSLNTLYLLGGIAVFILLLACINFMNLSTARSLDRAKEVGVRKTLGSSKYFLISQFLSESSVTATISVAFALLLAIGVLPYFNELTNNSFVWLDIITPTILLAAIGFVILIGFLSGLYPAFVLSSFKPIEAFKDSYKGVGSKSKVRKTLVTFQFVVSCFLIVCTLIVLRQLDFMQGTDPGFEKDQIIVFNTAGTRGLPVSDQYKLVKEELLTHSSISKVSASQATPGRSGWRSILAHSDDQSPDESTSIEYLAIDYDYVDFYGLEVVAGRAFSEDLDRTNNPGVVINEAALAAFGWDNPAQAIGNKVITLNGLLDSPVLGVLKNYHQRGLQQEIQPAVYTLNSNNFDYYSAVFNPANTTETIAHMQSVWDKFYEGYTFEYFFLDTDYARQYESERRLSKIYYTFSLMAIFIACLGLFGLTSFSTSRRIKEIGIRKVFGASVLNISYMITRGYLALVATSFLIAIPISYLFMDNWLQDFAYRISIGASVFALTFVLIIAVTVLTTGSQSLKAAMANPIKSLRSE